MILLNRKDGNYDFSFLVFNCQICDKFNFLLKCMILIFINIFIHIVDLHSQYCVISIFSTNIFLLILFNDNYIILFCNNNFSYVDAIQNLLFMRNSLYFFFYIFLN